jgi:hypothetical protein
MAAVRRLSLPRNMLARLLEFGIAVDRATFLLERGFAVRLVEAFPDDASPRNLLLVAEPAGDRTPIALPGSCPE